MALTAINSSNQQTIAEAVTIADNLFTRARGLLGRKGLKPGEGLLIKRCSAVHMFFMCFPIDVIFCSESLEVVGLVENLKPWRVSPMYRRASQALEVTAGTVAQSGLKVGDRIELRQH